jgi:membrane fusion protein, copper/silver efflux system
MKKPVIIGAALVFAVAVFFAGRYSSRSGAQSGAASRRILYYVDPMHPAYHSNKPGIAPDCGMPLEPVYEGEDVAGKLQLPAGAVSIDSGKQQLIGVQVETVGKNSGPRMLRTTGRVEPDDNRIYRLTAGSEGWVVTLRNNPAGSVVKKDQLLATFWSRELRNAEQAYLGSLATVDRLRGVRGGQEDSNRGIDNSVRLNEEQLRALGMGEPQIKALARTRDTTYDITLTSPVDGVVLSRDLSPGQRFDRGMEFYKIADLSKVWINADIFGDEAQWFRPGAKVKATVRELGKTLWARVTDTPPVFDPASRTLSLRLEADNPRLELRPDMFVDLEFNAPAPHGLSVPEEAVLDSGLQKIVYVETSDGVFEPRPVEIGTAYGDRVTITRGLSEGERVVTSGNFLIDSESRMRTPTLVASAVPHDAKKAGQMAMVHDPVCGMKLDATKARSSGQMENYQGETYLFCSDKCRKKFQDDPGRYAGEKLGSAAPERDLRRGDD